MAEIKIGNNIFHYEEIALSYETSTAIDREVAKELLSKVKHYFDENSLDFFLVFGTLLGAIRDHNFIKGDEDIDIAIFDEDKLLSIIPILYENNIRLCRAWENQLYSFMYVDGCYIDVYITRRYNFSLFGLTCLNLAGYATPKRLLSERETITFLGEQYKVPQKPERLLKFWYGATWNIPVSGHNYRYEIYLSYLYKRIVYYTKCIIKFFIGYKYWSKR